MTKGYTYQVFNLDIYHIFARIDGKRTLSHGCGIS